MLKMYICLNAVLLIALAVILKRMTNPFEGDPSIISNPSAALIVSLAMCSGSEYNLALGQKRAEAVLRALKIYGVKDAQMEAVSWGKTKPRSLGHDETAWAQNRRADLQYPSK